MTEAGFGRRRSIDVGGLALNLKDENHGHGWGGWDEKDKGDTLYAETLIDVRAHTEILTQLEPVPELPFTELDETTRTRLISSLGSWSFEPQKLPDEEVLACTYILFEALYRIEGMEGELDISLGKLAVLLYHFRKVYRAGNTYHNFRHAVDVLQATYFFLYSAGLVPPVSILLDSADRIWVRGRDNPCDPLMSCLTNKDLLALLIAAVGHDVGHPGLSNAFMKNANTPLSVMYEHKSPLEQMHANLILTLMRNYGLASKLDSPCPSCRKVLMGSVLATDLSIHNRFMEDFRAMLANNGTPETCEVLLHRRMLLCQAVIKCADISNPGRPYTVSQHWVAALESEWSSQLLLEQHLRLPESVNPSGDPFSEAGGQIWFINAFVRPLFELIAEGIPAMEPFAKQCRENLATWEARRAELSKASSVPPPAPLPQPHPETASNLIRSFLSAFPPTLPESFRTPDEVSGPTYAFPMVPVPPSFHRAVAPHDREPPEDAHSDSGSSHYHSCDSTPPSPLPSPPFRPRAPAETPRLTISPPVVSPASSGLSVLSPTPSAAPSNVSADPDGAEAIRAAYSTGMRKKRSFHRNSWNPQRSDRDPPLLARALGN